MRNECARTGPMGSAAAGDLFESSVCTLSPPLLHPSRDHGCILAPPTADIHIWAWEGPVSRVNLSIVLASVPLSSAGSRSVFREVCTYWNNLPDIQLFTGPVLGNQCSSPRGPSSQPDSSVSVRPRSEKAISRSLEAIGLVASINPISSQVVELRRCRIYRQIGGSCVMHKLN